MYEMYKSKSHPMTSRNVDLKGIIMKKWIFLLLIAPVVSAMAPNETMNHIGNKFSPF